MDRVEKASACATFQEGRDAAKVTKQALATSRNCAGAALAVIDRKRSCTRHAGRIERQHYRSLSLYPLHS